MTINNLVVIIIILIIIFQGDGIMAHQSHKEDGQGLVEYALILVLVAVVVIVVLAILGPTIGNMFSNVIQEISAYN